MAKFCGQCGTELKENAAFCPNCGAPCHADIRQTEQVAMQPKRRKKKRHVVITALCICLSVIVAAGATVGYVAFKDVERYYVVKSTDTKFASGDFYQSIETKYDEKGNVISEILKTEDDTIQRRYRYDENGLIKSISTKENGETEERITFSHSQQSGQTVAESTPVNKNGTDTSLTLEYIYNENYQLISQTTYVHDYEQDYISEQYLYEYYEDGTIKHKEMKEGFVQPPAGMVRTRSIKAEYDEAGNIIQSIQIGVSGQISSELSMKYRDSDSGRLQEQYAYRYEYDNGRDAPYTDKVVAQHIVYDKTIDNVDHYLCYGEGEELLSTVLYTYDEDGALLQTETIDDSQEKTDVTLYEYDEHGNLISQEMYDGEGNLLEKLENEYEKRTVKELFQKAF